VPDGSDGPAAEPEDPHSARPLHVGVVARPTDDGVVDCAVFPELRQGKYLLYRRPNGAARLHVTIRGGRITRARWPD
jgi:hypothetical protein